MLKSRTALLALVLAAAAYTQNKPNFAGTWKLNVAKSDFGMMPPPQSRTDVIEQSEGTIKDSVAAVGEQGPMNYTLTLNTDGSETSATVMGRDVKMAAGWSGPALAVTSKLDFDGNEVVIKGNWTLSDDGNTMTQAAHITSPMGEMDAKYVFEKQSGAGAAPATVTAGTPTVTAPASGAKPNFTGVWKLNVAKSDFGPIPGPDSETDTIEHNDPKIKLAVDQQGQQGKRNYEIAINIDGKEQTHKLGDQEVRTTAQWDGSALVVLTKLMFQDNEVVIKAAYTLQPDGKTVNVNTHLSSAMGEADQKMVYDKQ